MLELPEAINKNKLLANQCGYENLAFGECILTPSTNYNQFLPSPGLT